MKKIKIRKWWQRSDKRRIEKKINTVNKDGGVLFFCAGVYYI